MNAKWKELDTLLSNSMLIVIIMSIIMFMILYGVMINIIPKIFIFIICIIHILIIREIIHLLKLMNNIIKN